VTTEALAETTADFVLRRPARGDASRWQHPLPKTFCQQGVVAAGGLAIAAPGLYEAEIREDGAVALTLVRAVGWLARMDLRSRPVPAGPMVPTPGAQCLGEIAARLSLAPAATVSEAASLRDAELGFCAVFAGPDPLLAPGRSLLSLAPADLRLAVLKPSEDGWGLVARVLNPTDEPIAATLRAGFAVAEAELVRLDETPLGERLVVSVSG